MNGWGPQRLLYTRFAIGGTSVAGDEVSVTLALDPVLRGPLLWRRLRGWWLAKRKRNVIRVWACQGETPASVAAKIAAEISRRRLGFNATAQGDIVSVSAPVR